MLVDMHVHSTFSDGRLTIPQLVDFYGVRGFGAIAVTDHVCETGSLLGVLAGALRYTLTESNFPRYLETIRSEGERAWDLYRMHVIPGIELSKNSWSHHRSAHILGLGVSQWVSAEGEIVAMTKSLRDQGAVRVAAHPVHTGVREPQTLHLWDHRDELCSEFDAWEVASGAKFFEEVHASGLPMLATSDLHHPRQINSWKSILGLRRHEPNPDAILEAIRRQNLEFTYYNDRNRDRSSAC